SHYEPDGFGVDHGEDRELSAGAAGQGESGNSRALGNVSERGQTGCPDFVWDRCRGLSARPECEGIQVDGGSWDGANRCAAFCDGDRCGIVWDGDEGGYAGTRE